MADLLVVVLDAELREAVFDRGASQGLRADGVADVGSARKRLSKDIYAVVLLEPDLQDGAELDCGATPVIMLTPDKLAPGILEAQIREIVAGEGEGA